MAKDFLKNVVVAFKVDTDLYEFLDGLPNKSEFIRQAILAQLGMNCPLCIGSGTISRGLGEHYIPILEEHGNRACDRCSKPENIPKDLDSLPEREHPRWEQFLHGGPFYCGKCYTTVPACRVCGWRMPKDLLSSHVVNSHVQKKNQ